MSTVKSRSNLSTWRTKSKCRLFQPNIFRMQI